MKSGNKIFILIIALAAIMGVVFLSPFASGFPDGLEKVALRFGFADKASGFFNFKSIIPDYLFSGASNTFLQKSLSGFFGILIIFALFALIFWINVLVKKNKKKKRNNFSAHGE